MLQFAILLTVGYIAYLLYEKRTNDKYLSSFQYVIHVNGIRGKTSVCRLIDANLRGAGYRVFTKTTGTTPFYIDTAGDEHLIRRRGPANILEQLSIIKKAYQEKANVLILECMAVDPLLQKVAQTQIVKGNLNVITNVRYDHIFAMGETLDEIAASLSATIPSEGILFTADELYYDYFRTLCRQKQTQIVLCSKNEFADNENTAIAYEIGAYLGISDTAFRQNIQQYKEDFGANKLYTINSIPFLNLFSVNDPQSTKQILAQYVEKTDQVTFLYNHRADRIDRLLLFRWHFFPDLPCYKIVVIGEGRNLAKRLLQKNGFSNVETAGNWNDIFRDKETSFVVGIGNIKGAAYEIINDLEVDNRE